jgi:hypothetical protein
METTKSKLDALLKLPLDERQAVKAETKKIADRLKAAGYEVFGAGYGGVTMRLKPADPALTLVFYKDAEALLA